MAIGRVNTGGGGSGGTLTVTGIAGHTVTATKDGKTYTRTFNSSGVAVFKGLSTGTWTLTMTGDGQTATRTVDVNADYSVTITYFSATINVTYPVGSTCKATHTDGTVLNAPDTSGTWTCVVPKSGTWTILSEDTSAGKSKSFDINITADGQSESVTLSYELYLYKNGDKCTDVGGDWSLRKGYAEGVSVSYKTDYAQLNVAAETNQYMGNGFWYKNLDITNYSKLCAIVTYNTVANSGNLMIAVCNSATDTPISSNVARKDIGSASATVPFELDISSITGSKYIGIGTHMAETNSGTAKIQAVYLV